MHELVLAGRSQVGAVHVVQRLEVVLPRGSIRVRQRARKLQDARRVRARPGEAPRSTQAQAYLLQRRALCVLHLLVHQRRRRYTGDLGRHAHHRVEDGLHNGLLRVQALSLRRSTVATSDAQHNQTARHGAPRHTWHALAIASVVGLAYGQLSCVKRRTKSATASTSSFCGTTPLSIKAATTTACKLGCTRLS